MIARGFKRIRTPWAGGFAILFLGAINWAIRLWTPALHANSPDQGVIIIITVTLLVVFTLIKLIGFGIKWARVVLLVLFVASMLIFAWGLSALFKANFLVGVISLLQALLGIVALVFLFSKESTQWFNRVQAAAQDKPVPSSKN